MKLQILSHAGLLIETRDGKQFVCDPWLDGSCYWRSWWNYPPVAEELKDTLHPDWVYITHIHWDHYHAPSLRRWEPTTKMLLPHDRYPRMVDDMRGIGWNNITEMVHAKRMELTPDLAVTSYHFGPFLDSVLVIECEGYTILNSNDTKLMGLPLKQILDRHPKIDFCLRSHSAAGSRPSYQFLDSPEELVDDTSRYIKSFCRFMKRVKPTYAIPFASNTCHLHKDAFEYNKYIQNPTMVAEAFQEWKSSFNLPTEVKIMVTGDYWDSESGFHITPNDYFTNQMEKLREYKQSRRAVLDRYYAQEAKASYEPADLVAFMQKFYKAVPFFWRHKFRKDAVAFEIVCGDHSDWWRIDPYAQETRQISAEEGQSYAMNIRFPVLVLKQSVKDNMFGHAALSKRLKFRCTKAYYKQLQFFEALLYAYEYDLLPLWKCLSPRTIGCYIRRWRELVFMGQVAIDMLLGGTLIGTEDKYVDGDSKPSPKAAIAKIESAA